MDDEILEADGAAGVLEEVLQSVTAQALRMGRVEDGVAELRTHSEQMHQEQQLLGQQLQHQLEQQIQPLLERLSGAAAAPSVGTTEHALGERLEDIDSAAKRSAQRVTWILFLSALQMVLIAGLLGQSYMRTPSTEPAPAPVAAPAPAPIPRAPDPIVGSPPPAMQQPLDTVGATPPPPPADASAESTKQADKHHNKKHKK